MPKTPDNETNLDDFNQRLALAEADLAAREAGQGRGPSGLGMAFKLATEMVVAVCVGAATGWGIDYMTGLSPLFMLIFFFLGAAAGIKNVVASAEEMNKAQMRARDETNKQG